MASKSVQLVEPLKSVKKTRSIKVSAEDCFVFDKELSNMKDGIYPSSTLKNNELARWTFEFETR